MVLIFIVVYGCGVVMVMTILNGIGQPHISEPLSHSFSGGIVSVIVIVIVIVVLRWDC